MTTSNKAIPYTLHHGSALRSSGLYARLPSETKIQRLSTCWDLPPRTPRDQDSREILEPEHAEHVLLAPSLDRPIRVARPDPARVKLEPLTLGVAAQVALKLRRTGPLQCGRASEVPRARKSSSVALLSKGGEREKAEKNV